MINSQHPQFKADVRHLIELTIKARGRTPYFFRTEEYEDEASVLDSEWITCGHCSARVGVKAETRVLDTGYIKILDNVRYTKCCGPSIDKQLCTLACVCCQRPAAFITPHANDTGFTYEPGAIYHLDSCSECCGLDGLKSAILEQVVHNQLNHSKKFDTRIEP